MANQRELWLAGLFTIQISNPMWAPAVVVSLGGSHFIASDSSCFYFYLEDPKNYLFFVVVNFYKLASLRDVNLRRGKKT